MPITNGTCLAKHFLSTRQLSQAPETPSFLMGSILANFNMEDKIIQQTASNNCIAAYWQTGMD